MKCVLGAVGSGSGRGIVHCAHVGRGTRQVHEEPPSRGFLWGNDTRAACATACNGWRAGRRTRVAGEAAMRVDLCQHVVRDFWVRMVTVFQPHQQPLAYGLIACAVLVLAQEAVVWEVVAKDPALPVTKLDSEPGAADAQRSAHCRAVADRPVVRVPDPPPMRRVPADVVVAVAALRNPVEAAPCA